MSALTDLFTSLANKIRSKLGTSSKYTPIQAISAIDDVYNKGVNDTQVGNATADLVYRGRTFTNSSGVGLTGTMPSRIRGSAEEATTELSASDNCPVYVASNSGFAKNKDNVDRFYMAIPKNGYYTIDNAVLAVPCQTKNATPDISSQVINPDAGKALWGVVVNAISPQRAHQSVTAGSAGIVDNKPFIWIPYGYYPNQGNDHCGIYTSEAVAQAIHRHTGTYTFPANDTGGTKDLGEFHGYRYVNAVNVYNKGIADAQQQSIPSTLTLYYEGEQTWTRGRSTKTFTTNVAVGTYLLSMWNIYDQFIPSVEDVIVSGGLRISSIVQCSNNINHDGHSRLSNTFVKMTSASNSISLVGDNLYPIVNLIRMF